MEDQSPDAWRVETTPAMGRHLIAGKHVRAGSVVVSQAPYAAVLYDEHVDVRCNHCLRTSTGQTPLLRCSRSKHARYCSREHQAAAWAAGYKQECAALVACAPRVPPATVRLAARALWRMARSHQAGGRQPTTGDCTSGAGGNDGDDDAYHSWDAVQQLLPHWSDLTDDRKVQLAQMAVMARDFAAIGLEPAAAAAAASSSASMPLVPDDVARSCGLPGVQDVALLLARFACNNHTICDDELRPVGVGLYPLGALLNHSCTPNCMQTFRPRGIIEFRALRDITPGEPLTISYLELAATRRERRQVLTQTYHFDIDAAASASAQRPLAQPPREDGDSPEDAQTGAPAALPQGMQGRMRQSPGDLASCQQTLSAEVEFDVSLHSLVPRSVVSLAMACYDCGGSDDHASGPPAAAPALLLVHRGVGEHEALPPWPVDARDAALTQLVIVARQDAPAPRTPGSSGHAHVALPGGIHVQLSHDARAAADDPLAASIGWDDLEVDGDASDGHSARGKSGALARGSAPSSSRSLPGVEVECWGEWATHAVSAANARSGGHASFGSGVNGSHLGASNGTSATACVESAPLQAVGSTPTCNVSLPSLARRVAAAAQLLAAAERATMHGQDASAVVTALTAALSLLEPRGPVPGGRRGGEVEPGLGPCHLLRMRINAALLKGLIDDGSDWSLALQVARALLPVYQMAYPDVWPNLALHHATLAKLELLVGDPREAVTAARAALTSLRITHGNTGIGSSDGAGGVLQQVEATLREAEGAMAALAMQQL